MTKQKFFGLLSIAAAFFLDQLALAQLPDKPAANNSVVTVAAKTNKEDTAPKIKQPLPFGPGETAKFEIKFSRFPIFAAVGEMTFTITEEKIEQQETPKTEAATTEAPVTETKPAEPEIRLRFRGEAVSKGALTSLFGIKVKDIFESVVTKKDLRVVTATRNLDEGKRKREQTATFAHDKQEVTWVEKNLSDPKAQPKVVTAKTAPWVVDPIAAVYFLRTQELKIGQAIKVPISEEGKTVEIDIIPLAREEVKVDAGKFKTVKLEAKIFQGKLLSGDGPMYLWITDDEQRVPVKFQLKVKYGTVTGNLIAKSQAAPTLLKPATNKSAAEKPAN